MKLTKIKNENLIIEKNTKEPIIVLYNLKKKKENLNLKITLEKNTKASIIEIFLDGFENESYDFKREFITKKGSNLTYLKYQDVRSISNLNFDFKLDLDEKSTMQLTNLELGSAKNINTYDSNLKSEYSDLELAGLVKIGDDTKSSSSFNIIHEEKNCRSNIKYKHVLNDHAKAIFQAKSIVKDTASFSKVLQNTDTILLNENAAISTQPHLEINIDELEASHGATTGSLDENQVLYLQARGIKKDLARKILLKAFVNEIYDNIRQREIEKFLESFNRGNYV